MIAWMPGMGHRCGVSMTAVLALVCGTGCATIPSSMIPPTGSDSGHVNPVLKRIRAYSLSDGSSNQHMRYYSLGGPIRKVIRSNQYGTTTHTEYAHYFGNVNIFHAGEDLVPSAWAPEIDLPYFSITGADGFAEQIRSMQAGPSPPFLAPAPSYRPHFASDLALVRRLIPAAKIHYDILHYDRNRQSLRQGDLFADIVVVRRPRYGMPLAIANAVVCGATLTLIPCVVPAEVAMTLKVSDESGRVYWESSCVNSYTEIIWAPAILLTFTERYGSNQSTTMNQLRYLLQGVPHNLTVGVEPPSPARSGDTR